jgi:hypothetical protein
MKLFGITLLVVQAKNISLGSMMIFSFIPKTKSIFLIMKALKN